MGFGIPAMHVDAIEARIHRIVFADIQFLCCFVRAGATLAVVIHHPERGMPPCSGRNLEPRLIVAVKEGSPADDSAPGVFLVPHLFLFDCDEETSITNGYVCRHLTAPHFAVRTEIPLGGIQRASFELIRPNKPIALHRQDFGARGCDEWEERYQSRGKNK